MNITESIFGEWNGHKIKSYTISNDHGMKVSCIEYGGIITGISVPDSKGNIENVVMGFDTLEEYINHSPFFGAIIGRVAGRIAGSAFTLDGTAYQLQKNDGEHHLHGGAGGFHHVIWDSDAEKGMNEANIRFSYVSPDGEGGYPGTLEVTVNYTLNNENELVISYEAISDEKTIINLTNHTYFNLSGDLKRDILEHEVTMQSDQFLELDETLIPTGEFIHVENTPFDFRAGKKIKEGVKSVHHQNILAGGGYDHPFLLNTGEMTVVDSASGRKLTVETDRPSVVLYTANMLGNDFQIKGVQSKRHLGLCLETQCPPDAIHHENFPSIVLEKNEVFKTKTSFKFLVV
ncbi:aldose 1-epimerase [Cytobacillus firmus]|uniref:Aldose 1-epimerase n=2 Tax=Cytobacillus TaxID=2675230 RepID=A0A366K4L9_CYTFI|nr:MULTISPECIES: aldose epimerase family protein [Cytobacillus]RBP96706.1 aldose 1-epimerase [Cytobacillus firmus]TDX45567.1 aldose 1-epimerase [Cytobacillus oceanisediminis]